MALRVPRTAQGVTSLKRKQCKGNVARASLLALNVRQAVLDMLTVLQLMEFLSFYTAMLPSLSSAISVVLAFDRCCAPGTVWMPTIVPAAFLSLEYHHRDSSFCME